MLWSVLVDAFHDSSHLCGVLQDTVTNGYSPPMTTVIILAVSLGVTYVTFYPHYTNSMIFLVQPSFCVCAVESIQESLQWGQARHVLRIFFGATRSAPRRGIDNRSAAICGHVRHADSGEAAQAIII